MFFVDYLKKYMPIAKALTPGLAGFLGVTIALVVYRRQQQQQQQKREAERLLRQEQEKKAIKAKLDRELISKWMIGRRNNISRKYKSGYTQLESLKRFFLFEAIRQTSMCSNLHPNNLQATEPHLGGVESPKEASTVGNENKFAVLSVDASDGPKEVNDFTVVKNKKKRVAQKEEPVSTTSKSGSLSSPREAQVASKTVTSKTPEEPTTSKGKDKVANNSATKPKKEAVKIPSFPDKNFVEKLATFPPYYKFWYSKFTSSRSQISKDGYVVGGAHDSHPNSYGVRFLVFGDDVPITTTANFPPWIWRESPYLVDLRAVQHANLDRDNLICVSEAKLNKIGFEGDFKKILKFNDFNDLARLRSAPTQTQIIKKGVNSPAGNYVVTVFPVKASSLSRIYEGIMCAPRVDGCADTPISLLQALSVKPGETLNMELRWKPVFANSNKWHGGVLIYAGGEPSEEFNSQYFITQKGARKNALVITETIVGGIKPLVTVVIEEN